MPLEFSRPWVLFFLLALPAVWALARWSRSGLERGRSIFSTALRALLLTMVVLGLAEAKWIRKSDRVATIFALDLSASIPAEQQERAQQYVKERMGEVPERDRAGVVVFGEQAMIDLTAGERPQWSAPRSVVARSATDLGAAIRLALAAFPENYQRRIVLISDGNENRGSALTEIEEALRHGAIIDALPVVYHYPDAMWVEDLHVPGEITPKEPFDVTVVIHAQKKGTATLRLLRNDGQIVEQRVDLNAGKNLYTVRQKLDEAGPQRYEVHLDPPAGGDDRVYQNKRAFGYTHVRGEGRLLVVGGEPEDVRELVSHLSNEGIDSVVVEPDALADQIPQLSHYDGVVLANVGAEQLPAGVMPALDGAVHDAGVGLLAIGGERSFGPGGYRGTPLEEILPVTMDQPQRRVLPNGALALILHTVEIADGAGNRWAKEISMAAMNVLGPQDFFGIVQFGPRAGNEWVFKPRPVSDRANMTRLIKDANPQDMPDFNGIFQMAHAELTKVKAASKHIVILSDGDPQGPDDSLIQAMVKDNITLSTVVIGPHFPGSVEKMAQIARTGGGQAYQVEDPRNLPQIFIREAATIRRSMVIEQDFKPALRPGAPAFKGIDPATVPPLHGYVLTNPKPTTETLMWGPESDIIFGQWRYGLGIAAVFTSDAKGRWAKDWLAWPQYRIIWAQMVRSILRTAQKSPYTMNVEIEGGRGHVVVDAVDESGRYAHTLKFRGSVMAPGGGRQILDLRQTGPGRYEAPFDAGEVGIYSINTAYEDAQGKQGYLSGGSAVPYQAEFRDLKTNRPLLERVAQMTGGRMLAETDPVFVPLAAKIGSPLMLWPYLLGLALILFPLDVFVRRVAFEWSQVATAIAWARAKVRRAPAAPQEAPAPLKKLLTRKEEVRAEQTGAPAPWTAPAPSRVEGPPPSGAETFDLEARPSERAPAPAAAPPPKPAPATATAEAPDYLKRLMDAKKRAKDQDKS